MTTDTPNRLTAWARRLETCADNWAAKHLSPQEYAEAKAFDARLKRDFWRWLAIYLVIGAAAGAILALLAPGLGWTRSFVVAYLTILGVVALVVSAWFRYSRFIGPKATRQFAWIMLLLLAGGVTGAFVASLTTGKPLTEMAPERIVRILTILSIVGICMIALISGIAWLRTRDVRRKLLRVEAEARTERLERQSVQAELKMLQAQVEPHFLFNTLANLRHLMLTDTPQATTMLDHLIHYLRTALPEIRAESSTVGREIELAHSYLEILRIRMGGALDISADAPAELASRPFPPLVLLTLVENAIKHGIAPVGKGHVRVSAEAVDDRLRLTVEDDGRGLREPVGQGVGLANVRERLRALFGDRARLMLTSGAHGGAIATIEVPL